MGLLDQPVVLLRFLPGLSGELEKLMVVEVLVEWKSSWLLAGRLNLDPQATFVHLSADQ